MDDKERESWERLRADMLLDIRIDRILSRLGDADKAIIRESLASALAGECDEFFYRIFEGAVYVSVDEME